MVLEFAGEQLRLTGDVSGAPLQGALDMGNSDLQGLWISVDGGFGTIAGLNVAYPSSSGVLASDVDVTKAFNLDITGPTYLLVYEMGGGSSAEDTVSSGEDNVSAPGNASVTPLDDNDDNGIVGYLQDLAEGQICDAFTQDIQPEQDLIDNMIALINADNGADEQFATDITEAMEDYLESAHPAMVQAIVGMIEMLDASNEELVEWSVLKRARDLMELRKAELDTCLDERRDEGFDKVVSRLAAIAAPGQQLQTVADFIALAAQAAPHTVTVEMADGAGGTIQSTVDITSLVKGLKRLQDVRTQKDADFLLATQEATEEWSEAFKAEFLFKYDGRRVANQRDVDYADATEGVGNHSVALGVEIGEERVYVLATDQTDNVSGAVAAYWAADPFKDDNYQSWSIKAHDQNGAEVASGNYAGTDHEDRVKVGDQFPGALNSSTVFTQGGVDISGEIFGGGLAEQSYHVEARREATPGDFRYNLIISNKS